MLAVPLPLTLQSCLSLVSPVTFSREHHNFQDVFFTNYIPSAEDKIHSRLPTIDVHQYYFMLNKIKIEIYDAGGQASERVLFHMLRRDRFDNRYFASKHFHSNKFI